MISHGPLVCSAQITASENVESLRAERDHALDAMEKMKVNAEKMKTMYKDLTDMYMKLRVEHTAFQKKAKVDATKASESLDREMREKQELQWQLNGAWAEVEHVRSRASADIADMARVGSDCPGDYANLRTQLADALDDLAIVRQERADLLRRAKEDRDMAKSEAAEEVRKLKIELETLRMDRAFLMRRVVKTNVDLDRSRDDAQRTRSSLREVQRKQTQVGPGDELLNQVEQLTRENRTLREASSRMEEENIAQLKSLKNELRLRTEGFNDERSSLQSDLEEAYQSLERTQRNEQGLELRVSLLQRALKEVSDRFTETTELAGEGVLDQLVKSKVKVAELQEENVMLKGQLCKLGLSSPDSSASSSARNSPTRVSRTFHIF
eukprot:CAMPEP_0184683940 /NCGR_PEP_ID=MMETSP0312-20130426/13252_1 /TAXON_ID=31354 /ORGANISM="Compsopogon coeruleus, Strain SAG 36.94" /LENGTH=381 /DNA_ID=CAMNT_0027136675 /DNA_START=489 /DNA_END=1634 /DNA_ORIENTATION=+